MVDVVVIVGDQTQEELLLLAQSVDKQFCGGKAEVFYRNMIPNGLGKVEKLFVLGHANIRTIGDIDASEIVAFLNGFELNIKTNVYLCGCSTGNTNQQVQDNGFSAGLPLVSKIREWRSNIGIFGTRSTLFRRGDGTLYLAPSPNQGIIGNETGWEVFNRLH
jgi:hypothetical protein